MKQIRKFGALIIGAIFLYDFIITFSSGNVEQYEVIGLEVSKITYLAYLLGHRCFISHFWIYKTV